MKLQQYLLNHYLNIEFEDFSHKAVSALGILKTIKHNPLSQNMRYVQDDVKDQVGTIDDAIKKVQEIIDHTSEKVKISMFVLDRNILPQDHIKPGTMYTVKFKYHTPINGKEAISLDQDQIQRLLCEAMMQIHTLLMEHIAGYSEQMMFDNAGL